MFQAVAESLRNSVLLDHCNDWALVRLNVELLATLCSCWLWAFMVIRYFHRKSTEPR